MKIDKEYMEILRDRMEYFKDKKITNLTDEEINEFLNLKKEMEENFKKITDVLTAAWEEVYGASWEKYKERVLNRE